MAGLFIADDGQFLERVRLQRNSYKDWIPAFAEILRVHLFYVMVNLMLLQQMPHPSWPPLEGEEHSDFPPFRGGSGWGGLDGFVSE